METPHTDGQVIAYSAVEGAATTPLIYYINGIQTDGAGHARAAYVLSALTERVVHGVYNQTAGLGKIGLVRDLLQCLTDWGDGFLSKLAEASNGALNSAVNQVTGFVRRKFGMEPSQPVNVAGTFRKQIPVGLREAFLERYLDLNNRATAALFREMREHRGERMLLIAHSQGNLITADALWAMVIAYGEETVSEMRVY